MDLKVRVGGSKPIVVDEHGQPVAGARVHRVTFPEQKVSGIDGDTYEISGPGEAEATVDGRRVILPLCG